MPARSLRSSPRVPSAPVLTGTFQVRPPSPVVGAPTEAPAAPVPLRRKLAAPTPETALEKETVKRTVAALVGLASARTREETTGAPARVTVAASPASTA